MKQGKAIIRDLLERNLSDLVTRKQLFDLLGVYSPETMANYDSQGIGIPGKIMVGRVAMYPRKEVINWVTSRTIIEK